jgi:hypothetical protein
MAFCTLEKLSYSHIEQLFIEPLLDAYTWLGVDKIMMSKKRLNKGPYKIIAGRREVIKCSHI